MTITVTAQIPDLTNHTKLKVILRSQSSQSLELRFTKLMVTTELLTEAFGSGKQDPRALKTATSVINSNVADN